MTESDPGYEYVLHCPCGTRLAGATEDEIVEVAFAHLAEQHPDMADSYEREHILFMAQRYRR
ncbi:MAG TPA: hypothetical protein VFI47_28915 [Acidimicrobiales bacterium]|nr:hypothetical protein [Acidimicrobiales bacterium]